MGRILQKPWVLVVEDDAELRSALMDVLSELGVGAKEASDGREALRLLKGGVLPELILLDLHMPSMNGWEFRALQRREPALANIPVAIVSGMADGFMAECLDAAGYLHKPLGLQALDDLRKLLASHCVAFRSPDAGST